MEAACFVTPSPGPGNYSPGCHRPRLLNSLCDSEGPLGSLAWRKAWGLGPWVGGKEEPGGHMGEEA